MSDYLYVDCVEVPLDQIANSGGVHIQIKLDISSCWYYSLYTDHRARMSRCPEAVSD